MLLELSDSHVKVNCVLVGVDLLACWSSRLTLLPPFGEGDSAAALAIAVEIMPWSDFVPVSPSSLSVKKSLDQRHQSSCVYLCQSAETPGLDGHRQLVHRARSFESGLQRENYARSLPAVHGVHTDLVLVQRSHSQPSR